MFNFLKIRKKRKYSFVYKWGILSGITEMLLLMFSVFMINNIYELFENNLKSLTIFVSFYSIVAIIFTFFIIFGMPLYLFVKKKLFSVALLVLLMSIVTLFILFTILFLIII